ncbi:MAG TPA: membrane protein insertase YidC, partial [Acetobacteraceae bacterium]|nr:membrane protein insertase YidC [Acetobacteraceae bacterium]
MDQKRLFAAIALSIGILLIFDFWQRPQREAQLQAQRQQQQAQQVQPAQPAVPAPTGGAPTPSAAGAVPGTTAGPVPPEAAPRSAAQRLRVETPRLSGSLNLRGARLDDLVLTDYRETTAPNSAHVRLLAPRESGSGYFAQWGWTAADGRTRVPDAETDWTATGGPLAPDRPVTLSWDNGQGLVFEIVLLVDRNYMFTAEQRVRNTGTDPAVVLPWARIRRERTPEVLGFFILHEGFTGVVGERLQEVTYSDARSTAQQRRGPAFEQEGTGGWIGITDKYWLASVMPASPTQAVRFAYRHISEGAGAAGDRWQADIAAPQPVPVAPGATVSFPSRVFAGAKEVLLLDAYRDQLNIRDFDKAIDFGWFYFLTKPFFYALHWLAEAFAWSYAPYGLAILVFTL